MLEDLYKPNCIRTYTGLYMNVLEPTEDMICIEDIAHALAHQCRFSGHLPAFYSVAQHSYHVCCIAPMEQKLQGLLHDASEAYLMDIPTPIKAMLPQYKVIENNLMQVIAKKFGFDYPLHKKVKEADKEMLEHEWKYVMLNHPIRNDFKCWPSQEAKAVFLDNFKILTDHNNKN